MGKRTGMRGKAESYPLVLFLLIITKQTILSIPEGRALRQTTRLPLYGPATSIKIVPGVIEERILGAATVLCRLGFG